MEENVGMLSARPEGPRVEGASWGGACLGKGPPLQDSGGVLEAPPARSWGEHWIVLISCILEVENHIKTV